VAAGDLHCHVLVKSALFNILAFALADELLNWQTSLLCLIFAQVPHQPVIAPVPELIYWQ